MGGIFQVSWPQSYLYKLVLEKFKQQVRQDRERELSPLQKVLDGYFGRLSVLGHPPPKKLSINSKEY